MQLQRYGLNCKRFVEIIAVALVLLYGVSIPSAAQEMAVPISVQWAFFQKILSFQRVLKPENAVRTPVLAIVYQSQFRASLDARNEMVALLKEMGSRLGSGAIEITEIDLTKEENLGAILAEKKVTLLYVAPLRAYSITTIIKESRQRGILTMSGVPDYIAEGISVGLDIKGNKPEILINRTAARLEGVDFHSQLLKLATIVR